MRRFSLIAVVCAAALLAAGCGDKQSVVTNAAEGSTVMLGGLNYQVQLSRYLNPNDSEDAYYLRGLPQGTSLDPGKGSVWFAIWMRVKNPSPKPLTPVSTFTITDTQNNKFQPLPMDPKLNPFLYLPAPIPHAGLLPSPDTPASNVGPLAGALILFRLDVDSLQNRPLILHIEGPANTEAQVSLDL
jgi:hypothetical protein